MGWRSLGDPLSEDLEIPHSTLGVFHMRGGDNGGVSRWVGCALYFCAFGVVVDVGGDKSVSDRRTCRIARCGLILSATESSQNRLKPLWAVTLL